MAEGSDMNETVTVPMEKIIEAAKHMDWRQVELNGGPPCFHLEERGRFCGRAEYWDGHAVVEQGRDCKWPYHRFIPLHELLAAAPADIALAELEPVPMLLNCPECGKRHVDEGEFATKPHHTHACQHCGFCWRPAIVETVGVQFLPGYLNPPASVPFAYYDHFNDVIYKGDNAKAQAKTAEAGGNKITPLYAATPFTPPSALAALIEKYREGQL